MRLIFCTLILLFAAPAFGAESKTFKDWQANCNEFGDCEARFVIDADPTDYLEPDYVLTLTRRDYQTFWMAYFQARAITPGQSSDWTITIDEKDFSFSGADNVDAFDNLYDYYFFGTQAQPMLDALVPGTSASVRFEDENKKVQTIDISLSGIAAAMLWVDEQQGRIGSERVISAEAPTGLYKVEKRTPAPLPDGFAKGLASSECEELENLPHGDNLESYRLDARATLYIIPCWAGAYNFISKLFVSYDDQMTRLHFAEYSDALGWSGTDALVNVYFEPFDQTLTTFNKGRGIGDCGNSGLWQWQGSAFRMLEFAAKYDCDGEPGEFPVIYKADDYNPQPVN